MKFLIFISLALAIANALDIRKNRNEYNIESDVPSRTTNSPTKIKHYKRAQTTLYHQIQNITIFKEGWKEWDQDWFEPSSDVPDERIFNGVVKVELKNNEYFSLQSKSVQSKYGYIEFDYKITPYNAELTLVSFDDGEAVTQGNYRYSNSDWIHIRQEIKDHENDEYMTNIKSFAWKNNNNREKITLYLKNIVYQDLDVDVKKYDEPISVIDNVNGNCKLASEWKDISKSKDRTSFEIIDGKCVMKIKTSLKNPAKYELKNMKFSGGRFEITAKTKADNTILTWYALNSINTKVKEIENTSHSFNKNYKTYNSENFETENEYNTIKIAPVANEITYELTKFLFYPIIVEEQVLQYNLTIIDKPDVILDSNGLHWKDTSWGDMECEFQTVISTMVCTFFGKKDAWPAFSFKNVNNNYNGGTLYINMKVLYPDQNIQILKSKGSGNYLNILTFRATTEYEDYYIDVPSSITEATYKFAVQEATQQDNTYYFKKIIYYPPYIPIPSKESTSTTVKPTSTPTPTQKTEEEIYNDKGYEVCSPNTKVVYANDEGIFGEENGRWCAILNKDINKCWSILHGYPCCSSNAKINGAWGVEENGDKCGNNKSNVCWAKELGFDCCKISESESGISFVDESGPWGVKNNKWCGII